MKIIPNIIEPIPIDDMWDITMRVLLIDKNSFKNWDCLRGKGLLNARIEVIEI